MRVRRLPVLAALLLLAACAGTPDQPVVATGRAQGARGAAGRRRRGARAQRAARGGTGLPHGGRGLPGRGDRRAGDPHGVRARADASRRHSPRNAGWCSIPPASRRGGYAGVAALELHRLDAAEQHFAQLVESAYISPAAGFLSLLPVASDHGTPTDVTELFRRLVARHPDVAEGHYALGSAALRSENFALAVASARRATEIAPYWVPAKLLLARALDRLRRGRGRARRGTATSCWRPTPRSARTSTTR